MILMLGKNCDDLLIDSGAECNVCPKDYAPDCTLHALEDTDSGVNLQTVTGQAMPVYGVKYITYTMDSGRKLPVKFYVVDCRSPILSVSALATQGWGISFKGAYSSINYKGNYRGTLTQERGLYYLVPKLLRETEDCDYPATVATTELISKNYYGPVKSTTGVKRGGRDDYWIYVDNKAIRVHRRPRRRLYIPEGLPHEPKLDQLRDTRLTHVQYEGSTEIGQRGPVENYLGIGDTTSGLDWGEDLRTRLPDEGEGRPEG